jgi:hypothetical protein
MEFRMRIIWQIEQKEIYQLQNFVASQIDNAFVKNRIIKNVEHPPKSISIELFWEVLVGCLLTSQQRSGPKSYVTKFLTTSPFPLSYHHFTEQDDRVGASKQILRSFGGIRFVNRISEQLAQNIEALHKGLWEQTSILLMKLVEQSTSSIEREVTDFVRNCYMGIGPKQSRNLLQGLGLTKYEIPIDSRITKWLNEFGFPVVLSSGALSDPNYYNFVSDGIQAICKECNIFPCVLDAAIFSSFDGEGWNDSTIVW